MNLKVGDEFVDLVEHSELVDGSARLSMSDDWVVEHQWRQQNDADGWNTDHRQHLHQQTAARRLLVFEQFNHVLSINTQ